jgi:phospholipid/cholesterol/gamma-HCH transport system substrate-binding protein
MRKRVFVNLLSFLALSALLVYIGMTNFIVQQAQGMVLNAEFTDASGLQPRNDVTMRGTPVGSVSTVKLVDDLARVEIILDPGVDVPKGTIAEIVRRSPIGELTLELNPGEGPPLEDGAIIEASDTIPPPDVAKTIEVFAEVLHAVPSNDLHAVTRELANAVRGRGGDLARLSEAGADLPERILEVENELEALIKTGPQVTGVFADNADVLADDITQTKILAQILRDRRYDLLKLYREGASFSETYAGFLSEEKSNIACLIDDFGTINAVMAEGDNLHDLAATLDKNHFFFDAVEQTVQVGVDTNTWFRVQVLPHQEPQGRSYHPHRAVPDVYAGNACRSRYGPGVGPANRGGVDLAPGSKLHRGR